MSQAPASEETDKTTAKIREQLRSSLEQHRGSQVLGSQLKPMIVEALDALGMSYRELFPPGALTRLRSFVELYLAGLVEPTDLRQGSDNVYFLPGARIGDQALEPPPGRLWKSFVGISPVQRLVYDRDIASLKVSLRSSSFEDSWVEIAPVSLDEHRQMCRDFTDSLSASGRRVPELEDVVADYSRTSYPVWLKALRIRSPLDKEWGKFRNEALLRLFRTRLEAIPVASERIDQLVTEVERDYQHSIKTAHETKSSVSVSVDAGALDPSAQREAHARQILRAAIDMMDYDQLRKLELPVGVILDVVTGFRADK